ncbi:RING-type domain-containing protein, partial [Aphis craccivora]
MVDSDGKYSVMFACKEIISYVVHQGATELHADATFKVVPSIPHCRQLVMLHLILQNHSISVCFVLMEVKTEASYRKVLERFHSKFPEVRPLSIMIDFETAHRNVFSEVYPEAMVYSCWFHFVQRKIFKKWATQIIYSKKERIKCASECPECFSVYDQPQRTNNIGNFHSSLKQTFQVTHPNLWRMLEHLDNLSMKQHIVVNQLAAGMATTRNIKMKLIFNSLRIHHSTALLTTGEITIKEFLIQYSHCVDDSEEEADINVINALVVEVVEYIQLTNNFVDNTEINDREQDIAADVENQEVNNILNPEEEYNEADFFVPENLALAIWEEQYSNDEEQEIPYAPGFAFLAVGNAYFSLFISDCYHPSVDA